MFGVHLTTKELASLHLFQSAKKEKQVKGEKKKKELHNVLFKNIMINFMLYYLLEERIKRGWLQTHNDHSNRIFIFLEYRETSTMKIYNYQNGIILKVYSLRNHELGYYETFIEIYQRFHACTKM